MEAVQVQTRGGSGGVERFRLQAEEAASGQQPADCKQCYLNNTVDYVFRVNNLRNNNNVTFDRSSHSAATGQTIRIRVSSIDEQDDDQLPNTADQQLSNALQVLSVEAPLEAQGAASRSRSPSPLLEVPLEGVDISREIRRPPL